MTEEQPLKKILLMGLRNSGKTSIHRVVFDGKDPHETQHQETTTRITKVDAISNGFVKFQMWDFPGQNDWIKNPAPQTNFQQFLEGCGAIIFVIDVSEPKEVELLQDAVDRLIDVITATHTIDPSIHFEVFLHKVDKLTPEVQEDLYHRISSTVNKEVEQLQDTQASRIKLVFHLTSIYDHSVFKAFSLVVQSIVPQRQYLQALVEILLNASKLNHAMLFDSTSKLFFAADNIQDASDSSLYDLFVEGLQLVGELNLAFPRPADDVESGDLPETSLLVAGAGVDSAFATGRFPGDTHALIKIASGQSIYVKELTKTLSLVVIGDEAAFVNRSLIDYNIGVFAQGVVELFGI